MAALTLSAPPALAKSPPDAVSSVSVTRTDGSLTASWPAATGATYYHVDYSSDNGASWSAATERHPGTSITISVKNGAAYIVRVKARNADGDSGWTKSPTAAAYTPPPATAPDAPSSVSVARGAFGQGVLNVSWSAVSGAAFYNVRYSDDGGQTWDDGPSRVSGTSAAVSGVNDALPYYAAVQAENGKGASGWTQSALANVECPEGHACKTSAEAQSSPPDAPSSITLERTGVGFRGKGTLTASWPAVTDATKYQVNYTADKGRVWKTLASEHASNSITFEIWNGNTYIIGVRAGNANGWSGWTNSPESPPIPNPPPPTLLPGPDWVSVTRGNGTLTATWAPVSGAIKYLIRYSTDGWRNAILLSDSHKSTSITMTNANNGSTYIIGVRAGKSDNYYSFGPITYSAPSGPYVTTPNYTPPPSPTLTASAITSTGATLTIANRSGNWWYKADTGPHSTCSNIAVAGNSVNLSGLTPGTQYTYTAYSNWVCNTAIATASAFTTLGLPTLTVSNVTSSSATLNLSNYTGTWYSMRIHPDTTVCSVGVTGATQNRDNLTSNTTYAYTAYSDSNCTDASALDTAYFSTTDAAVGNLKEARESSDWSVGGSTDVKYATAFTTGAQAHGYNLTSVTLDFAARTGTPGDISVALHAAATNGTDPAATASATLSGSDPDAAGLQTYTCSTGCDLSASTTYFIVTSAATGSGSYNQRNTASDAETLQDAAGWSIADAGRSKTGAAAWAAATQSASMHVAANVKPASLTASGITSTGATLTIANHTGNWHHKETYPSTTATCSSANTGTTAALSSLTADNTYAYTAYSDSGCSAANALDTAYFSTTDDGVGNLNEESDFDITVGRGGSNNQSVTATFTTGSGGSDLESVTLRFADKSATGTPGAIQVTLHEPDTSNSSNPSSTTKATLTGSNPDTAGLYTYTCSTGCYLNPGSTYFVVVAAPSAAGAGAYSLGLTQSDDEINHPAANGWSIGNQGRHKSQRFTWTGHAVGRVASMHVAANDSATLAASSVGATTATLTIGGHTAAWWYDADTGPDTTCQSVAANTSSDNLTGLTAGETYVYSAYDKTGCADADLIAVAPAFTTSISVSNLDGTDSTTDFTLGTYAQGFTTGSANYTLVSATVDIDTAHSSISVSLRAAQSNGKPATSNRATLTGTPAIGDAAFTCDASNSANDCSLARNTKYFIYVTGSSGYLDTTDSNTQTLVPSDNGWSIEDAARQGPTFDLDSGGKAMMIKVEATPQPTLSAGSITDDSATLSMKHHSGDWWFMADTGFFSVNCESVSGTSVSLNNRLAKQTTYVFTAYSDSGCTTANALDSVTFKTTGTVISVSSVSGTGATLNIVGRTAAWWYDADTGPDTTCQSVAANTSSDTLTGLTAGSTYTYTAYSKTGCNAVDELDSVTFSTSDVSVGNLGEQADNASCSIGYSGTNSEKCATAFTTGGNSAGYTLKSVTGLFDAKFRNPGDIVVAIHAADTTNSSHPASSASITLTGSDPDAAGLHTFACSTGCDLTAGTTYFVVMSTADTSAPRKLYSWRRTTSDDETVRPSTATGWAIANDGLHDIGSGWAALPRNHTGVMHVAADEKTATLTASSITSTGATLTIGNYTQAWYYKADVGPHTTCQADVAAGTSTKALTGLTPGTAYTYSAYSDSGCTTANLLATASAFTTSGVSVSNLGETTGLDGAQVGQIGTNNTRKATGFRTGSNSGGYTLDSVTVKVNSVLGAPTSYTVAIHAVSAGNPNSTALHTLTGSAPTGAGEYTYNCSGSCSLDASTDYFLVLSATGNIGLNSYEHSSTTSDNQTNTPSGGGWLIADVLKSKTNNAAWNDHVGGATLRFKVAATAN